MTVSVRWTYFSTTNHYFLLVSIKSESLSLIETSASGRQNPNILRWSHGESGTELFACGERPLVPIRKELTFEQHEYIDMYN